MISSGGSPRSSASPRRRPTHETSGSGARSGAPFSDAPTPSRRNGSVSQRRRFAVISRHSSARAGSRTPPGGRSGVQLDDRVEVIHGKAHSGGLTLELGLWFRFVPRRAPVPERDGRPRPTAQSSDVLGNVHAWDANLLVAGEKAVAWFAKWRQLSAVLRWLLVGSPSDAVHTLGARGSATHALLTGYVAMQVDETAVARRYLGLAAASYREQVGDRRSRQTRRRRSRLGRMGRPSRGGCRADRRHRATGRGHSPTPSTTPRGTPGALMSRYRGTCDRWVPPSRRHCAELRR